MTTNIWPTFHDCGTVYHTDLLTLCGELARRGMRVDMILIDPPYQVTPASWDILIPLPEMWAAFKRVIKPTGAIVVTAVEPFTSMLVMSNLKMYRHDWVWDKKHKGNIFLADHQPLKVHEDVRVFSIEPCVYYPQMRKGVMRKKGGGYSKLWEREMKSSVNDDYYPTSILEFSNAHQSEKVHPTQKSVDFFRYLIRTYTRPGEVVFDGTCGSGTTAIAAREEGRRFIVGDSSAEYVQVTRDRLDTPYTPSFLPALESASA